MTTDLNKNDEIKDEQLEMVSGGTGGSIDEGQNGLGGNEGGTDGTSGGGSGGFIIDPRPPRYEKA